MPIAMAFEEYGPPEVLRPFELGELRPGRGQVKVRTRAAGVQPFDCGLRAGTFSQWMQVTLPCRLGNEFAGVVEEVGAGVTDLAAGDEVIGWEQMKSYAEVLVVNSDQMVTKPAGMSWEEAGVLSASGQTAYTALEDLQVGAGDTVLIHAAAGGVGTFAVQLARKLGATVIGTASERNHDYLRALGVTPVTYGPGLEERVRRVASGGVDAVLDCVGGEALDVSVRLVPDRTRIGTIADQMGASRLGVRSIGTRRSRARLAELTSLYEAGNLKISIWKAIPLLEAAKAHHEVETGHVRGKVVLTATGT
jgi:enoyl reductase